MGRERRRRPDGAAPTPTGPPSRSPARLALGRPLRDCPPLAGPRLKRALALVQDRLAEDLRLDDLAAAAGLSPFHFSRAFKAATGLSPHRFVTLRRVAGAQDLLRRAPARPLAGAATACGFAHHSHLTACFHKLTGTTPALWRRSALARPRAARSPRRRGR